MRHGYRVKSSRKYSEPARLARRTPEELHPYPKVIPNLCWRRDSPHLLSKRSDSVKSPIRHPPALGNRCVLWRNSTVRPRSFLPLPQKNHGRRINPAPVVFPLGSCLGCQPFQAVTTLHFEFVTVCRFLALDAVLGPRHRI